MDNFKKNLALEKEIFWQEQMPKKKKIFNCESLKRIFANKKKIILSFFLTGIFVLGSMTLFASSSSAQNIIDGDLIRNPNASGDAKYDIYIVKLISTKKFKRLILSPHVFDSYGHLSWNSVKLVDQVTMDQYTTSNLVRCSDPDMGVNDPKVYQLMPSGDTGAKTWLNMTTSEFSAQYDWDSIYIVNQADRDAYEDISDWATYINEEYGFEVKYPQNYIITTEENDKIATIKINKAIVDENCYSAFIEEIYINTDDTNHDDCLRSIVGLPTSNEEYLQQASEKLSQDGWPEVKAINGINFYRYYAQDHAMGGKTKDYYTYQTFHNDKCYGITLQTYSSQSFGFRDDCPMSLESQYESVFQERETKLQESRDELFFPIISTFKFID